MTSLQTLVLRNNAVYPSLAPLPPPPAPQPAGGPPTPIQPTQPSPSQPYPSQPYPSPTIPHPTGSGSGSSIAAASLWLQEVVGGSHDRLPSHTHADTHAHSHAHAISHGAFDFFSPAALEAQQQRRRLADAASLDFVKSMASLQLFDVANTGLKVSAIPSSLPRGLKVLSKSTAGCYDVVLRDSICTEAPSLQTVVLDGLGTDGLATADCEVSYWDPSASYVRLFGLNGKHTVVDKTLLAVPPTIPSCLFALTNLQTLHLSMNGYAGTLPSYISPSLKDLVISHNFITGSIPEAIQTRAWTRLDLSYNKLEGDIKKMRPPAAGGSIDVSVNRLSGPVPVLMRTAQNVSLLEGNLFTCAGGDRALLPANDPYLEKFSCGSDTYNSSLYACLAVVATGLSLLLWQALRPGADGKGLAGTVRAAQRALLFGIDAGAAEPSTFEPPDTDPEAAKAKSHARADPDSISPAPAPAPTPAPAPPVSLLVLFHLLVAIANVGVVIVVNIVFVLAQQSYSNSAQTAAKTLLAVFKVAWNSGVLGLLDGLLLPGFTKRTLAEAHKRLYGSRGTFLALLLIFNNIFAPLFSSAVADVTCFSGAI